jgi:hypothetical protein
LPGGSRLDHALARLADLAAERLEQASEERSGQEEYDNEHGSDDGGQLVLPADSKVVLEADNETFHLSIPRSNFPAHPFWPEASLR